MTPALAPIDGACDPKFAAVRAAFANNFAEHGEIGAAVTVFVGGRQVVDLWGGWADGGHTRPWRDDTLVNVYSVGKAITSICVLQLVQNGQLDLDAPVARWWPEFAAAGKEAITLRQLMSHRAGLPAIRQPLPAGTMLDWGRMVAALEAQAPWWTPGAALGYHTNTFGFLLGEPLRRVTGLTVGQFLRQRIAGPLGADMHIGLPQSEHGRVAEFIRPEAPASPTPAAPPAKPPEMTEEILMRALSYNNPPGVSGGMYVNMPEWRLAEVPSTNGHGSARGVARIYQGLLDGLIAADVLDEATTEHSHERDLILDRKARFGLGFQLTQEERKLGPNPRTFGHFGASGSLGFCDPDAGVAFGYVMNRMGGRWQNPCNRSLVEAVYGALV